MTRTTFFGREADLEALHRRFGEGDRVITVTGVGGTGKTRLARRYAELHTGDWTSVWFCDLTEARTLDAVCSAVGRTLDVTMVGGGEHSALSRIGAWLATHGRMLLVLDNCEQAIDAVTTAISEWSARSPETHFLLTSRALSKLAAERVFELSPLPVPEAMSLFVERAQRLRREYRLTDDETPRVAEIVERLDGLPLAIELAAARMSLLSTRAILERLPQRLERMLRSDVLELLSGGARDLDLRQQTMRAAIDWSWALLPDFEQAALCQCAVFRGGFSPEAAEHVIDVRRFEGAPSSLDVLQSLREQSLVRAFEVEAVAGEMRCGLFDVIRDFAAEALPSDDAEARHRAYFVRFGTALAEGVPRSGGVERLRRLVLDLDNLRAAHRHASHARHFDDAAHVLLAMDRVLAMRGPIESHLAMLDDTLSLASEDERRSALFAKLLLARGVARGARGKRADALPDWEAALTLARASGDRWVEGRALGDLGTFEWQRGELAQARAMLWPALEASRAAGDREQEGITLGKIANLTCDEGRFDEAATLMEEALRVVRASGDRREEGIRLASLGVLLHRTRRFEQAMARQLEAHAAFEEIGDPQRQAISLGNVGIILKELDRVDEAETHFDRALRLGRHAVDRRFVGVWLASLGSLRHEKGALDEAERCYGEAVDILGSHGETKLANLFRGVLGAIAAQRGDVDAAVQILDACDAALSEEDAHYRTAIELYRGHVSLARADRTPALALVERTADAAKQSDAVSAARRVLVRALAASEPSPSPLCVATSGLWFRLPSGERVDLEASPTLGKVLLALARKRVEAPGKPLSIEALIAEGWPGERILPKAGATRAYTMLTKLRKLGLRDILHSRPSGYFLDPAIEVRLEQDP